MARLNALIPLFFMLLTLPAQACRCIWEGNFTNLDLGSHTIVVGLSLIHI